MLSCASRLTSSICSKFASKGITRPLEISTVNPSILQAEYAVRGEIVMRAEEIKKKMLSGQSFPFDDLIFCNIGNPFAVGKKAITFPRQVVACVENPDLLQSNEIPDEAKDRAREFLQFVPAGLGAYTNSMGIEHIRKHIAEFIKQRDGGVTSNPDKIFLTSGASSAVSLILKMIISSSNVGILTPFPTYPLYTAEIILDNGQIVPYYLQESTGWQTTIKELEHSYEKATKKGIEVKAIVVINPGNPTGNVMTAQEIRNIVEFCDSHNILIIADEVYQENIYNHSRPFVSFKRIVSEMKSEVQLVSLNSISKGFLGECGHRAGYMELTHIPDDVKAQIYKLSSISLCPNAVGQLVLDILVDPPKSHECKTLWDQQTSGEVANLRDKSQRLAKCINDLPGLKTQPADGAMYLFPSIHLPLRACEDASNVWNSKNTVVQPDMFWCIKLLEEAGIVVVPGNGFGQVPGTYHFRTTFLPDGEKMDEVIERMTAFQTRFMETYA